MIFPEQIFEFFIKLDAVSIACGFLILLFLNAIILPIPPEFFAVIIFMTHRTVLWAVVILLSVFIAPVCAMIFLYVVAKRNLLPKWMTNILRKYYKILIIKNEKIIFLNTFVPILPFQGVFVAICNWNLKKCIGYLVAADQIKYSLYLIMCETFFWLFSKGIAQQITLIAVIVILGISIGYALYRRKKNAITQLHIRKHF